MADETRLADQTGQNRVTGGARYVTIFFSDIVGFSELTDRLGDHAASVIVNAVLSKQTDIITRDGRGRVIKFIGDSIFAVFDTPSIAMTRSLEIQRMLKVWSESVEAGRVPPVRMGLHVGEVLLEEGGRLDIVGRHVNRARRVMDAADGGQILASRAVIDAGKDFIDDVPSEHLVVRLYGEHYLKGLGATELCEIADTRARTPQAPRQFQQADPETALIGRLEAARYQVLGRVGEGAFGVVYRAKSLDSGQIVALKVLSPSLLDDAQARRRFTEEAKRLAELHLPGLLKILEPRVDHNPPFIVMEFVSGRPVDVALRNAPPARIARVFRDIAMALRGAHECGIIHCDVKPANILVREDDSPVILDFGMSALGSNPAAEETFSSTAIVGTPSYLAPEQMSARPKSPQSDIYSLGVILFEVLTGRKPFIGDSIHQIMHGHLYDDPPLPSSIRANVPEGLQRICLKAIEKDPANRYPDLARMADDLERFMRDEVVRTRPTLYENLLYHRARHHVEQVEAWCDQGLLNEEEKNRLLSAYDPLLRRGIPAVMEGRLLRFWQIAVYVGGWLVVNGASLWLWLHWRELNRTARLSLGSVPALIAIALAVFMWRLERFRLEFFALIVLIIATPLISSVWLHEFNVGLPAVPNYELELLVSESHPEDGLSNLQLFIVGMITLSVAGTVMVRSGTVTYSAQAAVASLLAYSAFLALRGARPIVEQEHWAGLALRYVPFLIAIGAVTFVMLRNPRRQHQAAPWLYLIAAVLIGIFLTIPLYGMREWFDIHTMSISYLLLCLAGAGLAMLGIAARKGLAHRGRIPTLAVTLTGLVTVLAGLRLSAIEWPQGWILIPIGDPPIRPPDVLMLLAAVAMSILGARVQMLAFVIVGLGGLATALHVIGHEYLAAPDQQWWPAAVIAAGLLLFALSLSIELRRTRGNALDDMTLRTRL